MKIILEGPQGKREIPENPEKPGQTMPYKLLPGEQIIGILYERAAPITPVVTDAFETEVVSAVEAEGFQWGDLIAGAIRTTRLDKLLGKTNCSRCERRILILNKFRELGIKETLMQLKETLRD